MPNRRTFMSLMHLELLALIGIALYGCQDKAESSYAKCVQLEIKGDIPGAWDACNAAIAASPTSDAGNAAARKLKEMKPSHNLTVASNAYDKKTDIDVPLILTPFPPQAYNLILQLFSADLIYQTSQTVDSGPFRGLVKRSYYSRTIEYPRNEIYLKGTQVYVLQEIVKYSPELFNTVALPNGAEMNGPLLATMGAAEAMGEDTGNLSRDDAVKLIACHKAVSQLIKTPGQRASCGLGNLVTIFDIVGDCFHITHMHRASWNAIRAQEL